MKFSDLLASITDGSPIEIPADWQQGRAIFGGLQVAIAVRAMRTLVPDVPLRTLQCTFVAPSTGPLHTATTILRRGGSAIHVEARLLDGERIVAIVVGVFGTARASVVAIAPSPPPIIRDNEFVLPFLPGMPAFLQHFRATVVRGTPPFAGSTETEQTMVIELLDRGPTTEAHAIAIADFVPPVALSHLTKPSFGSTLTWMLELFVDRFDNFALADWRIDATLVAARDGYTSQAVRIYAPDGTLVAISHQSMVVFG